jgi:hypothetical protein
VPQFAVSFTLDAADLAAAEKIVGEWKVTAGAVLHAITGETYFPPATDGLPQPVPPTGDVGDALEAAEGVTLFLYRLEPESATQKPEAVQLHLHGAGFTTASQIVFGGVELATAHVSETELYCTIDVSTSGHAPGTFDVLVRDGAQQTKALPFTIAP